MKSRLTVKKNTFAMCYNAFTYSIFWTEFKTIWNIRWSSISIVVLPQIYISFISSSVCIITSKESFIL